MSRTINIDKVRALPQLGAGACATVYRYNDKALKIFKDTREIPSYEELMQIAGMANGTCIFPEDILQDERGQMVGYIMDYVEGPRLMDSIGQIDIQQLQGAIAKVEQDLQTLAYDKVVFNDFNIGNVMWDNNSQSIKIIDTDFYQRNTQLAPQQVFGHNLGDFNTQVETIIGVMQGDFADYLRESSDFNNFYNQYTMRNYRGENVSINELISVIKSVTEKDFGRQFSTLGEMQQAVQERMQTRSTQPPQFEIPTFQPPETPQQMQSQPQSSFTINEFGEIIRPDNFQVQEQSPISQVPTVQEGKQTFRQRVAQFLQGRDMLMRVPLVENFVNKQLNVLPPPTTQPTIVASMEDTRQDFLKVISGNGEFRKPEYSKVSEQPQRTQELSRDTLSKVQKDVHDNFEL